MGARLYVHIYEREGMHSIQPSAIFYKRLFYPRRHVCVYEIICIYVYLYVRKRERN